MNKNKFRLAVIQSHPIQYFSPLFRALAATPDLDLHVFYCLNPTPQQQGIGFGVKFEWDIPLLGGYSHEFLTNRARRPGLEFLGCDTPTVRDLVASRKFDAWLIPGWNLKSYWQAMKACWRFKVPMLVRGESHLLDRRPLHVRWLKRVILGCWIPRFSAYLTIGKLNAEFYKFYGGDPSKCFAAPYCVDNVFFAGAAAAFREKRAELRNRWLIPQDAVVFLFCAKFLEKKRPMDILLAAERVAVPGSRIHLLMVGDGPLRSECESYALKKRVPVTFAGFLNQREVAQAYAACDVLILPSGFSETWGLVVNEAMACGLPAIVSDKVGCGPDLIMENKTGFVFPCGDIAALARILKIYAGDPSLAVQHGQLAREKVNNHYNIPTVVRGTLAALRHLTVA